MTKTMTMILAVSIGGCAVEGPDRLGEAAQADSNRTVFRTTWDDLMMAATWGDYVTGGEVYAFVGGTGPARVTQLVYRTHGWDPTISSRYVTGSYWGTIPDEDLDFGAQEATLQTTFTGNVTGMECWFDYMWFTSGCDDAPLAGGADITAVKDRLRTFFHSGVTSQTSGGITVRQHGISRGYSGLASGSIAGRELVDVPTIFDESGGGAVTFEILAP